MLLTRFFSLGLVSVACASSLGVRQTTNTNAAINSIVDSVDKTSRNVGSTINTLQANHTLNSATLGAQLKILENSFSNATTQLAATAPSAGSTTVSPTNDDIGDTFGDALQLVATSLSGIAAQGSVSTFSSLIATLDPIVATTVKQFNTTAPHSFNLVHIFMLDAQQFLADEGMTQTRTALGFT